MCLRFERYQRLYEAKRKAENNNLPLIHGFLGKHVKVKVDDCLTVEGVLIRYQMENKAEHKPSVLVLKNSNGFQLLRGNFENISEV